MVELKIRDRIFDKTTSVFSATLETGLGNANLSVKFAQPSKTNATRPIKEKELARSSPFLSAEKH
jgi:hypothetical protein